MNPFEYMQALAELWGRSGKGFADAQQGMFRDMAERMTKAAGATAPGGPAQLMDTQAFAAAGAAFSSLWTSAQALSQTLSRNIQKGAPPDPTVTEMRGQIFDPR